MNSASGLANYLKSLELTENAIISHSLSFSELDLTQKNLIQEFITHPYLVDDRKFSIGIWVGFTSAKPLRAYVLDSTMELRFCEKEYDPLNLSDPATYVADGMELFKIKYTPGVGKIVIIEIWLTEFHHLVNNEDMKISQEKLSLQCVLTYSHTNYFHHSFRIRSGLLFLLFSAFFLSFSDRPMIYMNVHIFGQVKVCLKKKRFK